MPLTVTFLKDAPDRMTREDFAKRAGVHVNTVDTWRKDWLPFGTLGRKVVILRDPATAAILKQSKGGSV